MKPEGMPDDLWDLASKLATIQGAEGGLFTDNYVLPLATALWDERRNAAFADWSDPEHIKARLNAYIELEDEKQASNTPLPVHGYTPQPDAKVALVNEFEQDEERLLRKLDTMRSNFDNVPEDAEQFLYDMRWISVARTHFQEGFMALNRAVFQPQRITLPEDEAK